MFLRHLSHMSAGRLAICVAVFYACLAAFGIVNAVLWSQVTFLNELGWTVSNWHAPFDDLPKQLQDAKELQHPAHRLRYFLTVPLFWLSDRTQISVNSLFSVCIPIMAALTVWSAARVLSHRRQDSTVRWIGLLAILPLMGIFLAMDGRLILAFGGSALMLAVHLGPPMSTFAKTIGTVVALWLCAVTSGTLYATFAALLMITFFAIIKAPSRVNKAEACLPVIFAILLFNYDLLGALTKNITYFGGGFAGAIGMLQHGFGAIFLKLGTSPTILAILSIGLCVGFCVLAVLIRRLPSDLRLLAILVCTAIAMGAFGYSTLALALIPTCILFGCALQKFTRDDSGYKA